MALILSDYTDNATLRGLLGIAETEIPDDIFDTLAPDHLLEVTFSLEALQADIPALFEAIKGVLVDQRSVLQNRFYNLVQLYAAYTIADKIANGQIAMFAPISITDAKATQQRMADPYAQLRVALKASLATWRKRLGETLSKLDPTKAITTAATVTLAGSAGLAVDPVLGV